VNAGYLMAGAGADELIDVLLRVVVGAGDVVLNCPPTFGMYGFSVGVNAGITHNIPRLPDFSLDVPAIVQAAKTTNAKVLFLCSPNNPTGNLLSDGDLRQLLDLPLLVVLDEAYIEFASQKSRIDWVTERENLVVLRTFSKWAGLAGLRVGWGAFPHWLGEQMWKIKQPYNVNVPAQQAALASLHDLDYLWGNVERIKAERERLFGLLQGVSFLTPFASEANFVLCRVDGRDASGVRDGLRNAGILVRYFATPLLQNYIRITVGKSEQTDVVMSELKKMEG
jgi:histidinol-phosphate aminotransferase